MAINRICKTTDIQKLVGRYVVKLASTLVAAASNPAKVVSAQGKTCAVESVPRWWSDEDKVWVFGHKDDAMTHPGGEPLPSVQLRSLYMACDTFEELNALLATGNRNVAEFNALLKRSREELDAMAVADA